MFHVSKGASEILNISILHTHFIAQRFDDLVSSKVMQTEIDSTVERDNLISSYWDATYVLTEA